MDRLEGNSQGFAPDLTTTARQIAEVYDCELLQGARVHDLAAIRRERHGLDLDEPLDQPAAECAEGTLDEYGEAFVPKVSSSRPMAVPMEWSCTRARRLSAW